MSFSFSPGMGPRGAIRDMGQEGKGDKLFNRRAVAQMLRFVRPYRRQMAGAFLFMLLATGCALLAPYLIKTAIDDHIAIGDVAGLSQVALYIGLAYLGLYIAGVGQEYLLGWTSQRVLADARGALLRHLQKLSLGYHDRTISGVTVSRVINDVAVINDLLTQGVITLLGDLLVLAGIVAIMLNMSPELALYTFAVLPLMIGVTYLFSRYARDAFRQTRQRIAALVGSLAETSLAAFASSRPSPKRRRLPAALKRSTTPTGRPISTPFVSPSFSCPRLNFWGCWPRPLSSTLAAGRWSAKR
jgi:ABC-type bacteriocin/lantibiotic exporter with double-glycine peptidase domain